MSSLVQRLQRVPTAVIDAGLALALAVAITIAIDVSPEPGARREAAAYLLGWTIAALVLARRRWPLAVLLASAVILQLYYQLDYPGIYPAVPLSVALATAWAAGHRCWSLLVAGLFVAAGIGVGYQILAPHQPALQVLGDVTRDIVLFAAVLLLGEAVCTRRALQREEERSERLLLNVLPAPIATRLKQHEDVIADGFPEVTVLFADLVDFTRRSQRSSPQQIVQVLDELFSTFDQLTRRHRLEKIKTIGDAYMVAGGLPEPRPDHAQAVADLALSMQMEMARRIDTGGQPLQARIGIDTGPVVAGVIGADKFSYDLWGDTVNTASRMESTGVPGCIAASSSPWHGPASGPSWWEPRSPATPRVEGSGRTVLACPTPSHKRPTNQLGSWLRPLGQLPLQGCPDALTWFKAAARWPQSPCSKPTTTQASPTNGTTYTRAMRAGRPSR